MVDSEKLWLKEPRNAEIEDRLDEKWTNRHSAPQFQGLLAPTDPLTAPAREYQLETTSSAESRSPQT